MYDKFIKIITNSGPIELLIINGKPTRQELISGWESILNEYCEIIRTPKTVSIIKCWRKIKENENKMILAELCIFLLKCHYDQDVANILLEMGYTFVEDKQDYEEYYAQIEIVENEIGTLVVLTNQLYNEYKMLCPKEEQLIVRTEMDYEKELATLSKYQGSWIIKSMITVFEVAAIINNYIEENSKIRRYGTAV